MFKFQKYNNLLKKTKNVNWIINDQNLKIINTILFKFTIKS